MPVASRIGLSITSAKLFPVFVSVFAMYVQNSDAVMTAHTRGGQIAVTRRRRLLAPCVPVSPSIRSPETAGATLPWPDRRNAWAEVPSGQAGRDPAPPILIMGSVEFVDSP